MKVFPPSPAAVDVRPGTAIWTTRPPVGAPAATEIVIVAFVPPVSTARFATVIAVSATLFLKNVIPVAPLNPDPTTVTVTFALPTAALDGTTAEMNGWSERAAPTADAIVVAGEGGAACTWTLTSLALLVPDCEAVAAAWSWTLTGRPLLVVCDEGVAWSWTLTLPADTVAGTGALTTSACADALALVTPFSAAVRVTVGGVGTFAGAV